MSLGLYHNILLSDDSVRTEGSEINTFADLRSLTNRFANLLQQLGVAKGETVYVLTGRIPEPYVAAWRSRARSYKMPSFTRKFPANLTVRVSLSIIDTKGITPAWLSGRALVYRLHR